MTLALIHPPLDPPSGGNRYNAAILQQAERQCFPLHSLPVSGFDRKDPAEWQSRYGRLIWDSFFWEQLAALAGERALNKSGLLCHFLPSQNPLMTASQRNYWRRIEDGVLDAMLCVIATGSAVADQIRFRFPGKTVGLSEPGVDEFFYADAGPGQENLAESSSVHLLTVANLLPEKGFSDVLQALEGLIDSSWIWHVCGSDQADTGYAERFWRAAESSNLRGRIRYEGVLAAKSLSELMRRSDIVVTASYYESYGMALAEAAALRLPLIASNTGAAGQIIRHGDNGFLFPVGDVALLRAHLRKLMADTALRVRFRRSRTFKRRSWEHCFADFWQAACR